MHYKFLILLSACIAALTFASENVFEKPITLKVCHEDPNLVGVCFSLRGRLNYWNGTPSVRIWKVGTKRILGVTESRNSEGYATYPDGLLEKMNWETNMFADFVVFPYTKENPEDMQFVCIDSASRITLKEK